MHTHTHAHTRACMHTHTHTNSHTLTHTYANTLLPASFHLTDKSAWVVLHVATSRGTRYQHDQGSSSQRYYLSTGPHTPLSRQDLSHNANLNSSHNASELPMKDTWDDKDPQPAGQQYAADHLVFSFERLGSNLGGAGGTGGGVGGLCLTETLPKSDEDIGLSLIHI